VKLITPMLLRQSLDILGAIASNPSPKSQQKNWIENRIHIEWGPYTRPVRLPGSPEVGAVTLTATDSHRSLEISIAQDPSIGYNPGRALIVAPAVAQWPRLAQLDAIFLNAQGHTCAIRAPGAEPAIQPWGIDLGAHPDGADSYPIEKLREIHASVKETVGTVRMMELNPEYMADGLSIITALWDRAVNEQVPRRLDMHLPGHKHAPMMFDSQHPYENPIFSITYVIMPYRTP
jgi:hypothetical protein